MNGVVEHGSSGQTRRSLARQRSVDRGGLWIVVTILGSRLTTAMVLLLFALQSAWIALSARPVIYDEAYHLAAIDALSRRATPFIDQVVADGAVGDIERYGSWLYHYLMSFPWRGLDAIGVGDGTKMVAVRLLTVAIVTAGLFVCYRLFRELGASSAVANVSLMIVSSAPLLVFLSGAVNYDNLLFLLASGFFLAAVRLWKAGTFEAWSWLSVIALGTWASLTKYTFLPIFGIIVVMLLCRQIPRLRRAGITGWLTQWRQVGLVLKLRHLGVLVLAVLGTAAFVERYVVNVFAYGALTPDCSAVHEIEICEMHGPWSRNRELDAEFDDVPLSVTSGVSYFSNVWTLLMFRNATLIGVDLARGGAAASRGANVTGALLTLFVIAMFVALVLCWGAVKQIEGARLLLAAAAFFLLVLFVQNYTDYASFGQGVGVATRYALVVYPLLVGIVCIAVNGVVRQTSRNGGRLLRALLVLGLLVGLSQGGGFITYLWSADTTWLRDADSNVGRATKMLMDAADTVVLDNEVIRDPRF